MVNLKMLSNSGKIRSEQKEKSAEEKKKLIAELKEKSRGKKSESVGAEGSLQAEVEKYKGLYRTSKNKLKSAEKRLKSKDKLLVDKNQNEISLKGRVQDLRKAKNDLTAKVKQLSEENIKLNQLANEQALRLSEVEGLVEKLEAELDVSRQRVASLRGLVKTLIVKTELSKYQSENYRLKKLITYWKDKYRTINKKHADNVKKLSKVDGLPVQGIFTKLMARLTLETVDEYEGLDGLVKKRNRLLDVQKQLSLTTEQTAEAVEEVRIYGTYLLKKDIVVSMDGEEYYVLDKPVIDEIESTIPCVAVLKESGYVNIEKFYDDYEDIDSSANAVGLGYATKGIAGTKRTGRKKKIEEQFDDLSIFGNPKILIVTSMRGAKYVNSLKRHGLDNVEWIDAYEKSEAHVKRVIHAMDLVIVITGHSPHAVNRIIDDEVTKYGNPEKYHLLEDGNDVAIVNRVRSILVRDRVTNG